MCFCLLTEAAGGRTATGTLNANTPPHPVVPQLLTGHAITIPIELAAIARLSGIKRRHPSRSRLRTVRVISRFRLSSRLGRLRPGSRFAHQWRGHRHRRAWQADGHGGSRLRLRRHGHRRRRHRLDNSSRHGPFDCHRRCRSGLASRRTARATDDRRTAAHQHQGGHAEAGREPPATDRSVQAGWAETARTPFVEPEFPARRRRRPGRIGPPAARWAPVGCGWCGPAGWRVPLFGATSPKRHSALVTIGTRCLERR